MARSGKRFEFDVALSFAGEDRPFVEATAQVLREMGIRVFYDKYETVKLWGKDLYDHLTEIYKDRARFTVMFISKSYAKKLWTNHERKSAQARAFAASAEYILPARFDNTKIPGVLPTVGYVNLKGLSPKDFAEIIKKKVGPLYRKHFLPDNPDVYFAKLKATHKRSRERASLILSQLFDDLALMRPAERALLARLATNACPAGLPENLHMQLDLLGRHARKKPAAILEMFSRLECLNFHTEIDQDAEHGGDTIRVTYEPLLTSGTKELDFSDDGAGYVYALFDSFEGAVCPDCTKEAIKRLDFSHLSNITHFPERDHLEHAAVPKS